MRFLDWLGDGTCWSHCAARTSERLHRVRTPLGTPGAAGACRRWRAEREVSAVGRPISPRRSQCCARRGSRSALLRLPLDGSEAAQLLGPEWRAERRCGPMTASAWRSAPPARPRARCLPARRTHRRPAAPAGGGAGRLAGPGLVAGQPLPAAEDTGRRWVSGSWYGWRSPRGAPGCRRVPAGGGCRSTHRAGWSRRAVPRRQRVAAPAVHRPRRPDRAHADAADDAQCRALRGQR